MHIIFCSNPKAVTNVLSSSGTAPENGGRTNLDKNNDLSSTYYYYDGNKKRVSKMTVLSLSIYDPLLCRQILLATMHYESEDKEDSETFRNLWNEALSSGLEERYMFNSTVLMLGEEVLN